MTTGATAFHGARSRMLVTPEGVPVTFRVASIPERIGALAIDVLLMAATIIVTWLVGFIVPRELRFLWAALALFGTFVIVHGWFAWFEGRTQGATPGKRVIGIRVIDAAGGPLGAGAVLARNLTRIVEIEFPLILIAAPTHLVPDMNSAIRLIAGAWILLLVGLPALPFNRDRQRLGDFIAGTIVVATPKERLRGDVARSERTEPPRFAFTTAQLSIYGAYELQVLEDLLRDERGRSNVRLHAIAAKIRAKIDFGPVDGTFDAARFLNDFYRAQRAHLERELLLGRRKESKLTAPATRRP